ncbi:MAG: hypothetical protein QM765_30825 [Myxococcales bacterium]
MRASASSVTLAALSFACLLGSAEGAPTEGAGRCSPTAGRALTVELGSGPNVELDLYAVPQGTSFVVTDVIALREGNADGVLRLLAGQEVVATVPLVGIVSHTDLYGTHLVTGISFPGGQTIRVRKAERGVAWVTIVGYDAPHS